MTLLEGIINESIFIDFEGEIRYGSDQVYDSYPCRFPTVDFCLQPNAFLVQLADRIRKEDGMRPMYPMDEYTDDMCDQEGWYDFYLGLNGYDESHVDSCIRFYVVNSNSPDNEELYLIDLDEEEQKVIYDCLDAQCRRELGKSCEDLLAEAESRMEKEWQMEQMEQMEQTVEEDEL